MTEDYKWYDRSGEDRRRGKDRRINPDADYKGPERRKGERRSGEDRRKE
jgi:hypothetical protein